MTQEIPEQPNQKRGEQHLDDRTPLGYAYEGNELVAILYKKKALEECEASAWLTVSRTPEGERL